MINERIQELVKIVHSLNSEFPHKKFMLDGRLVGDIGEIFVEQNYDVKLFEKLVKQYDGTTEDNRKVQIKATFKKSLNIPCEGLKIPDYYLGIKIFEDGSFEEIYNCLGINIWNLVSHRKPTKNGLHSVAINLLKQINASVAKENKIAKKRS